MMEIKFSKNWNGKLDQKVFTTIRKWSFEEANRYIKAHEFVFDVFLGSDFKCPAKLIGIEIMKLKSLPDALIMADTGEPDIGRARAIFLKFGIKLNDVINLLTFERLEVE